MRKLTVLFILAMVAGSASAAPKESLKEKKAREQREAQMIAAAKKAIAYTLTDPDSANFREVYVAPNEVAVCGQVNAKNSFGGYVGFRRFIYSPRKQGIDGDGCYFVEARWESRCVEGVIASDDKPEPCPRS